MSDPENFISRWSRRKHEAATEDGQQKRTDAGEAHVPASDEQTKADARESAASPPEFDISSLPPIESIGAGTDITAFMRPGVPAAMRHAALRRVWSADPAIRDFMGPTENYWDAAGPDGIPGFGDLDPNLDVQRLVSELFGEAPRQDASSESGTDRVADSSMPPIRDARAAATPQQVALAPAASVPQRSENAAAQTEPSEPAPEKKISRRHGGAIPK
jgi:Protein of unknown function (DUF3306)